MNILLHLRCLWGRQFRRLGQKIAVEEVRSTLQRSTWRHVGQGGKEVGHDQGMWGVQQTQGRKGSKKERL